MIQFSKAIYSGSEESQAILVTINLVGGVASSEFYFSIITSAVSATGNHISTIKIRNFSITVYRDHSRWKKGIENSKSIKTVLSQLYMPKKMHSRDTKVLIYFL